VLIPAFAALAVVGAIPALILLRGLSGGTAPRPVPVQLSRNWPAWSLAGVATATGAGIGVLSTCSREPGGTPDACAITE